MHTGLLGIDGRGIGTSCSITIIGFGKGCVGINDIGGNFGTGCVVITDIGGCISLTGVGGVGMRGRVFGKSWGSVIGAGCSHISESVHGKRSFSRGGTLKEQTLPLIQQQFFLHESSFSQVHSNTSFWGLSSKEGKHLHTQHPRHLSHVSISLKIHSQKSFFST
ncbi:Hypothetical predicted protein [Mytilus galloprovincialis]|uniref:Uncharacterized protein n=1 Tax=Mytilus galloprovincialis TaxID=29158 RepID=A0A8B6HSH5_MYTGA|nr:Hypothetical predicted protein [Mytilus galloprovincialis]